MYPDMSVASWSLDALGLAVLTMIEPFLGAVVMLGLDDTLARHAPDVATGKRVTARFGNGPERSGFQKAGPMRRTRGRHAGVMTTNAGHRVPDSWPHQGGHGRGAPMP